MFKIKEIIDGFVELILDLPLMFFRTHAIILLRGPRGMFLLARSTSRSSPRYLRPRTVAFLEIVILYVLLQAVAANTQGLPLFAQSVFVQIFNLNDASLHDREFIGLLALFFAFYYVYYVLIKLLRFKEPTRTVLTDACLYYSTLGMFLGGTFVAIFLGAINASFSTSNERLMRAVLLVIYAFSFGQLGILLSARLKLHKYPSLRYAGPLATGLLCFIVFAAIVWISLGKEGLWPNLHI